MENAGAPISSRGQRATDTTAPPPAYDPVVAEIHAGDLRRREGAVEVEEEEDGRPAVASPGPKP